MNLSEQVDLVREHWMLLQKAAEEAEIPEHTMHSVLAALLAESLAEQPEHLLSEWLAEVEDNVHRLRSRVRDGVEG